MLNLTQQGDGANIKMDNSLLQTLQPSSVNGIQPVIINITPITNYMPLLGLVEDSGEQNFSQI